MRAFCAVMAWAFLVIMVAGGFTDRPQLETIGAVVSQVYVVGLFVLTAIEGDS